MARRSSQARSKRDGRPCREQFQADRALGCKARESKQTSREMLSKSPTLPRVCIMACATHMMMLGQYEASDVCIFSILAAF
jgi:hypothetical protein